MTEISAAALDRRVTVPATGDEIERLAALNPKSAAKVVSRLLEAHRREFWQPDPATLAALKRAGEDIEDRLEGIGMEVAA